jgi:primosomal replication protein N
LDCNQIVISGTISEVGTMRYTPAGVAVAELRISHVSRQMEAGKPRRVECEVSVVALAQMAEIVARTPPGTMVKLAGFMAKKSRMSTQLVLHVNQIDFI